MNNDPNDPNNLEGYRSPEEIAAERRELQRIASTAADKFRLMFGHPPPAEAPKLSGLYIVNTFDQPCERLVAMLRKSDGSCWYVSKEDGLRKNPRYFRMTSDNPTPIEHFGLDVAVLKDGRFHITRSGRPSCAKYGDGRIRQWQGAAQFILPGGKPWEEIKGGDDIDIELLRDGFSTEIPDRCGLWNVACGETDYEPHHVAVYYNDLDGNYWVHDPENGTATRWLLNQYHHGLTGIVWKIEP